MRRFVKRGVDGRIQIDIEVLPHFICDLHGGTIDDLALMMVRTGTATDVLDFMAEIRERYIGKPKTKWDHIGITPEGAVPMIGLPTSRDGIAQAARNMRGVTVDGAVAADLIDNALALTLSMDDFDRLRTWFNALNDITPFLVSPADRDLMKKIAVAWFEQGTRGKL